MKFQRIEHCEIPNNPHFVNLVTNPPTRYGRLIVIEFAGKEKTKATKYVYKCQCDCGNITYIRNSHLTTKQIVSCGCYNKEKKSKHNLSHTPEYTAWKHLKERCSNTKCREYCNYGARGIRVCDEWKNSFVDFLVDMGRKPSPKHSIERINNDGNYCFENCKWATNLEQGNNKRWNVYIEYRGEKLSISQLARKSSISRSTLEYRLKNDWSIEDAVNIPPKGKKCQV